MILFLNASYVKLFCLFRSFCAQLLANGGLLKPNAETVPVHGFAPGKALKKPKARTVLIIAPDDEHSTQGSLTKKAKTLSSILITEKKMVRLS